MMPRYNPLEAAYLNTPAESVTQRAALAAPSQPADQNECSLCNGMGFIDGIGTTCPHCVGEGSEPVAQAMGAPEEWAEFQQWRRMKKIFVNRPPSPASADFDFPGPNDRDEPVAQAAQQPFDVAKCRTTCDICGEWPCARDVRRLKNKVKPKPVADDVPSHPAAEQAAADQLEAFDKWARKNAPFIFDQDEDDEGAARLVKAVAWLAWQEAARRPVRELTDEDIRALAEEHFDATYESDDETLVNKYGHGVYLSRFIDFARALLSKATGEGKA